MRSIAELKFRARQEIANLYLLAIKPECKCEAPERLNLPDAIAVAKALRSSSYADVLESTARQILAHGFPLLGATIETGREIRWRRDYSSGKESGTAYFKRIPYLNFEAVGDHKFVWELNRHQQLVLLAQAHLITGADEFLREIVAQFESWFAQNPFQRGINWASALEVAFRALSWIWLYHLIGSALPGSFRNRFLSALYQHGRHLAENLSIYFSPNTHLLGEAVALYAIGSLFESFPQAAFWRQRAGDLVEKQLAFQVRADGSHFEQSSYYHLYALDFFVFYYLLAGRPKRMVPALERMAEYLHWLLGPARRMTFFGDDDGGRLFHPYGDRDQFGRSTLATCGILFGRDDWTGTQFEVAEQAAWWLGASCLQLAAGKYQPPTGAQLFPDAGAIFLQAGDWYLQMDAGPFGWAGAGHSHTDALSLVLWIGGEPIFRDPGTFTYVGDNKWRNWFRSTAAHNTVCVDNLDQALNAGSFRWATRPEVEVSMFRPLKAGGRVDAICRYREFRHRRRVLLQSESLLVLDEVEGPTGHHECRQVWQLGSGASQVHLSFSCPSESIVSQFSPAYGAKESASAIRATVKGFLPLAIAALIDKDGKREISVETARQVLETEASL